MLSYSVVFNQFYGSVISARETRRSFRAWQPASATLQRPLDRSALISRSDTGFVPVIWRYEYCSWFTSVFTQHAIPSSSRTTGTTIYCIFSPLWFMIHTNKQVCSVPRKLGGQIFHVKCPFIMSFLKAALSHGRAASAGTRRSSWRV